jgi:plastocyanin
MTGAMHTTASARPSSAVRSRAAIRRPAGLCASLVLVLELALCTLGGLSCIDYDSRLRAGTSPEHDAAVSDAPFVSAIACSEAGEAQLHIVNAAFNIECGCMEGSGKTCTVPAGTKVTWIFGDSEEHNVASVTSTFGPSGELLSGSFSYTFAAPGRFAYGCAIHRASMSGYAVVVR